MNEYCARQRVNSFSWQSGSFSSTRKNMNSYIDHIVPKNDGFLKEFVYVNEKGESKSFMAWVPHHN